MNRLLIITILLFLILFSIFFWWFGPRRENLIKQCSKEIFEGQWTISGSDERVDQLEKLKAMQDSCLLDKGIY